MVEFSLANTMEACGTKMVACDQCKKTFRPLFEDNSTQAMFCSADIFDDISGKTVMTGHYGSTVVDGHRYDVLTNEYKQGTICDPCIIEGMKKNHFKLTSSDNYF